MNINSGDAASRISLWRPPASPCSPHPVILPKERLLNYNNQAELAVCSGDVKLVAMLAWPLESLHRCRFELHTCFCMMPRSVFFIGSSTSCVITMFGEYHPAVLRSQTVPTACTFCVHQNTNTLQKETWFIEDWIIATKSNKSNSPRNRICIFRGYLPTPTHSWHYIITMY